MSLRRRLAGGVLLLAVLTAAGGFHNHEDLSGVLREVAGSSPSDRVVSSHSPLSKASHWHSGVRVKDNPCLACHVHRTPALARGAVCVEAALSPFLVDRVGQTAALSATLYSEAPRGPPFLS